MISNDKYKMRSLGKLRRNSKTKEKSPDMIGKLEMQRHTFDELMAQFAEHEGQILICNIAGWVNKDGSGEYLTIELSPHYESHPERSSLRFIFGDPDDSSWNC